MARATRAARECELTIPRQAPRARQRAFRVQPPKRKADDAAAPAKKRAPPKTARRSKKVKVEETSEGAASGAE